MDPGERIPWTPSNPTKMSVELILSSILLIFIKREFFWFTFYVEVNICDSLCNGSSLYSRSHFDLLTRAVNSWKPDPVKTETTVISHGKLERVDK